VVGGGVNTAGIQLSNEKPENHVHRNYTSGRRHNGPHLCRCLARAQPELGYDYAADGRRNLEWGCRCRNGYASSLSAARHHSTIRQRRWCDESRSLSVSPETGVVQVSKTGTGWSCRGNKRNRHRASSRLSGVRVRGPQHRDTRLRQRRVGPLVLSTRALRARL